VLRKKFSWKHYPELERFLIANRDEYLKHSALNYTAEQKQYNNWLTERVLEVAARHNYVFDEQDFNFVAIRDRIRCYYKSYVQTARKRGLDVRKKRGDVLKTLQEKPQQNNSSSGQQQQQQQQQQQPSISASRTTESEDTARDHDDQDQDGTKDATMKSEEVAVE